MIISDETIKMYDTHKFKFFFKILQAENNETAYQMADRLKISPAFLSKIMTNTAKLPPALADKIIKTYRLNSNQQQELKRLQIVSASKIDLNNYHSQLKQMLINLACDYTNLSKEKQIELKRILLAKRGEK